MATSLFGDLHNILDKEFFVLGPTTKLSKGDRFAASELKVEEHFTTTPDVPDPLLKTFKSSLAEKYKQRISPTSKNRERDRMKVTQCQAAVYTKLSLLRGPPPKKKQKPPRSFTNREKIRNETELRMAVGDPIMEMMCEIGDAQLRLEESVSINENVNQPVSDLSGTPSTKVSQSISKGSRVDYSLYTMRDRNDDVVVVIMETKMEARSKNVKAQVMGYVAAYYKGKEDPPAALVLTESALTFLLFPFVSQQDAVERCFIGAGCTLDLWTEQDDLCQGVVHLLAQLVDGDMRKYAIEHHTAKSYEFMRNISILPHEETEVEKLMIELKDKEREIMQLKKVKEREIMQLKKDKEREIMQLKNDKEDKERECMQLKERLKIV